MKVLVYTETFWPSMGGLERNSITLANCLAADGHQVMLMTRTRTESVDNYAFNVLRTTSKRDFIQVVRWSDLVIVNGGVAAKICLPAIVFGKPYILIYQSSALSERRGSGILAMLDNKFRRWIARRATRNVGVSQYAASRLVSVTPHPVALVNPVDEQLEKYVAMLTVHPIQKKYDLLFAGRLIEGKGIFILLDALKILDDIKLAVAIVGEGSDESKLKSAAATAGVELKFLGRLDQEELVRVYLESKILVVPSSTHIEGFPLVISEACFAGIPAIVSDQPAMVETVGDAGYSFESGNAAALASCIRSTVFDGAGLERLTANAKRKRDVFSHKVYSGKLREIISEVHPG
jgi:glycosyltransferase involved in cell wall biosynthesis